MGLTDKSAACFCDLVREWRKLKLCYLANGANAKEVGGAQRTPFSDGSARLSPRSGCPVGPTGVVLRSGK